MGKKTGLTHGVPMVYGIDSVEPKKAGSSDRIAWLGGLQSKN